MSMDATHSDGFWRRWKASSIALVASLAVFVAAGGAWVTLNHYRVQFYDSSVEGPDLDQSPYWVIVAMQEALTWPIRIAAVLTGLLMLVKAVTIVAPLLIKLKGRRRTSPRSNTT